jgi:hypothetical protein
MANGTNSSDPVPHFLKLYEIQKDCFDKRRVTVWTVSISFWTAIAVGTGFLLQKVMISKCAWWFFALAFVAFCFGWLMRVWYADQIDHVWMYVYRSHAEKALGIIPKVRKYEKPSRWKFLIEGFTLAQVVITGLLLFASWYLLSTTKVPPPHI